MSDDRTELLLLEQRRCAAVSINDEVGMRRVLAEDYLHCHATGLVQSRDEQIQHVLTHPREIAPREPTVRVFGDVAVLTGPLVNITTINGERKTSPSAFVTQVAVRTSGEWKFVSFQATLMPAA